MPKPSKEQLKRATKKVIKELNEIGESINNTGIRKALVDISSEAIEVARSELLVVDPKLTSQQLSPQEAAAEIQAVYNSADKSVSIVATLDYSKRNAMYFLEYGAGLSSTAPDHTKIPWIYKVRHADSVHEKITKTEAYEYAFGIINDKVGGEYYYKRMALYNAGKLKKKPKRFARYFQNDYETKIFDYKGNQYGVTASSKPIGYMKAARYFLNRFASKKMAKAISVYITKRTNKPRGYSGQHYDPYDHIKDIY